MPRWEAGLAQTGEPSWVHPRRAWRGGPAGRRGVLFCFCQVCPARLHVLALVGSSVRPRSATKVQQGFAALQVRLLQPPAGA